MPLALSMLTALTLTLVLELSFALVWGVRKQGLVLVILMNILTNPAVNLLWQLLYLVGWSTGWALILLEAAVVVVEGFCCRGIIRRPWLLALLVNAFSYGMGELLQFLL